MGTAAGVAREDTREGHVREMEMSIDDIDTDVKTAIAGIMRMTVDIITVVASAQGRDLEIAGDTGVARQGIEGSGTETDVGVMIE